MAENVKEEKQMTNTEYIAKLQKELDDFTKTLDGKNAEELAQIEQDVIKEIDTLNAEIGKKEFELPSKGFKAIAEGVVKLLDKKAYNWQSAFGMCALYEFWQKRPAPKGLPYAILDTTLNTIGGMEFKGYKEGKLALDIIDYISPIRDEYAEMRAKAFMLAEKHNVIQKKMGLEMPIGTETPAVETPSEESAS